MERLMQYVWQHHLFPAHGLRTVDGRRVNVINPGLLNTGPGPDFFNASIRIDGQNWVGNIEIHVRASDWHRHGHDSDRAYDSVILHVVDSDDTIIRRPDGQIIPQMVLPCSPNLNNDYYQLTQTAPSELPCLGVIREMPKIYITDWISALAYERLYEKVDRINTIVEQLCGDWETAAYITLARALGFGINAEPMERLARATPISYLRKHMDSLLSVEAMLFGQAGLIPDQKDDEDQYITSLRNEYAFFAGKFGLQRPESFGWKQSGVRPGTFPFRRIAQLALLLTKSYSLMRAINNTTTLQAAREMLEVEFSGFWANHYSFAANATESATRASAGSTDIIIINAIVPLIYAYANRRGDFETAEKAVDIWHALPGERNRLTNLFAAAGLKIDSAFTSQACIQLRRSYCEQRKCLFCRIGHRHLSDRALRK